MTQHLVKAFNALPQSKGPNGTWHFDLRYNPLEPAPCHVLILMQPNSGVIHVERLPIGLPADESGIEFFPESVKEATPEITKSILHIFVNKLNTTSLKTPAPAKLSTRDRELAPSVTVELKRLNVRPSDFYRVSICTPQVDRLTDTLFEPIFQTMKKEAGYTGAAGRIIPTPESIGLWNFRLDPVLPDRNPSFAQDQTNYLQLRTNAGLPTAKAADMSRQFAYLTSVMQDDPKSLFVKAGADDGNPDDALDYALRLHVGLGCKRDRTRARYYAVKAIKLPDASDAVKVTAHGLLIDWLVHSSKDDFRKRYMYSASHHASVSAIICRRLYVPSSGAPPASPAVLWFMQHMFLRQLSQAPELKVLYKDAMWAIDERTQQLKGGQKKMQAKKLKFPLRYRCAAVGCGVEADRGKMLAQCAGKCDPDKKPSYCSKECQRADWKNHKPYCRPGAECSVIDDGSTSTPNLVEPIKSSSGALQVPIKLQDGSMQYVSSSTMDAEGLKELRDLVQENLTSFGDMPSSISISLERL
ncbi:hypothetical protein BDN70DRAFT_832069 [Pholiota conissans]|uniref:MYND-type domain-containing protein n=1 Tax=Pholiota conissans TaxID=109636 RepID=A0A9P5Z7I3_9AGAR|nr:hypothetical protein BDN70DRAFT_832069 [Pholiota conissans]